MKKLFIFVIAFLCGILFLSNLYSQNKSNTIGPQDLIYLTENYPPANYIENGKVKGVAVDLLKVLWRKMDCPEQDIKTVPWSRGYRLTQIRKAHVLFSMTRTAERENLFKWVGPIFTSKHVFIGRVNTPITIASIEDAKKYKIGVVLDDICELTLLEKDFSRANLKSGYNLDVSIKKLMSGEVDLICHSEAAVRELMRIKKYDLSQIRTLFVVDESHSYYGFHIDTPDALILKFQDALKKSEAEHREILKRYNVGL